MSFEASLQNYWSYRRYNRTSMQDFFRISPVIKINFFCFQFSVSPFTWQIWQTNNSIESYKPNRIMNKALMLCLGPTKSLSSLRLELTAQGMVQCTDDQSRVWYHSAMQAPLPFFQFDRMVRLFFNFWPFATLKISPIMSQILAFCNAEN